MSFLKRSAENLRTAGVQRGIRKIGFHLRHCRRGDLVCAGHYLEGDEATCRDIHRS